MLFSEAVYKVLKQVALVWLPALASLYLGIANLWDLPAGEAVAGTIMLVDTFLGVVLGISTKAFNQSDQKFDGEFEVVHDGEGGQALSLKSIDYAALNTKDELIFRLHDPGK